MSSSDVISSASFAELRNAIIEAKYRLSEWAQYGTQISLSEAIDIILGRTSTGFLLLDAAITAVLSVSGIRFHTWTPQHGILVSTDTGEMFCGMVAIMDKKPISIPFFFDTERVEWDLEKIQNGIEERWVANKKNDPEFAQFLKENKILASAEEAGG